MSDLEMEAVDAPAEEPQNPQNASETETVSTKAKQVEDMTFEEKCKELKSFSPYDKFKPGTWVDAQDTVNVWCHA
jgi:hypothetical protein